MGQREQVEISKQNTNSMTHNALHSVPSTERMTHHMELKYPGFYNHIQWSSQHAEMDSVVTAHRDG